MLHVVNVHWMCVVDSFLRLHALQEHTPSPAVKLQVTACALYRTNWLVIS